MPGRQGTRGGRRTRHTVPAPDQPPNNRNGASRPTASTDIESPGTTAKLPNLSTTTTTTTNRRTTGDSDTSTTTADSPASPPSSSSDTENSRTSLNSGREVGTGGTLDPRRIPNTKTLADELASAGGTNWSGDDDNDDDDAPPPPYHDSGATTTTTTATTKPGTMAAVDVGGSRSLPDLADDHPSLSASLEDFEHHGTYSEHERSPMMDLPSYHSGMVQSDDGDSSIHSDSGSAFFPPGERRLGPGSVAGASGLLGWSTHQPYQQQSRSSMLGSRMSLARSREPTEEEEEELNDGDDDDSAAAALARGAREASLAARVRLPTDSPLKRSPSPSPLPDPDGGGKGGGRGGVGGGAAERDVKKPMVVTSSDAPAASERVYTDTDRRDTDHRGADGTNNYFRFAMRAEVQHRTEPVDAAIAYVRRKFNAITGSRISTLGALLCLLFAFVVMRVFTHAPPPPPAPDLVKVAGLARSFEPLIFYSETASQQISELQETGVAVWDLSESVRSTNMTSSALIVAELDELSENIKSLAIEQSRFFANVDSDVDGILIVMEWAKRELSRLAPAPTGTLSSGMDNLHTALCRIGVFEKANGDPTMVGKLVMDLFGQSHPQRTQRTLQRTFNEFLTVLEEGINNELTQSTALFGLLQAIDAQFLNLQRSVIRESDAQEREEGEVLASLWTRVLGQNALRLRKFEKNRTLLSSVRETTYSSKHVILDHNAKLLTLKASLETLRKKLVSPLVRSENSSTLTVEEQVLGLDGTYGVLRAARERQKQTLRQVLFSAGNRPAGSGSVPSIDAAGGGGGATAPGR